MPTTSVSVHCGASGWGNAPPAGSLGLPLRYEARLMWGPRTTERLSLYVRWQRRVVREKPRTKTTKSVNYEYFGYAITRKTVVLARQSPSILNPAAQDRFDRFYIQLNLQPSEPDRPCSTVSARPSRVRRGGAPSWSTSAASSATRPLSGVPHPTFPRTPLRQRRPTPVVHHGQQVVQGR